MGYKGSPKAKKMIPATQPVAKKKTVRLRSKALREIRSEQASTRNLIPTAPFHRLVKEIASQQGNGDIRFRRDALDALQADAEAYTTEMFASSNLIAIAGGRETLHVSDLKLFQTIKG
jgi:histone H3/H4|tara:strand:+ start:617 stop:970 length:354 start_codon:yes stop_codon:yes gene_type:complete